MAAPERREMAPENRATGALNLIKLCVGAESVADLAEWQAARAVDGRRRARIRARSM